MVQRKVTNKLGIQADHVKSEKLLVNLKPSSFQHQDGKNRGGVDLTKKMKKSRSIKHSDFESSRSPNLRRQIPQPGKPPPLDVPTSAASPQKKSPIKASDVSPNYMKSTSCSDARKERSQVSTRNSETLTDSKSSSRMTSNNSKLKLNSASSHKSERTLTRTSSLKLVRTLTKTPSFKPARVSAKKCSPVVLCENLNVQRATCSSALKDSKFPALLALNPGGTESEGTSAMKVCPYTYCSLNGHHHPPLPPLKCFVSARRRMLKTQKSIKLRCLSPRRARPSGVSMKDIYTVHTIFNEKPPIQELELDGTAVAPLIQEEHADFFIEIYCKDRDGNADTNGRSKENGDDHGPTDLPVVDIMPSVGGSDETGAEHDDGQTMESLSDEPPQPGIDFKDYLDQQSDVISTEMDVAEFFFSEGDQNVEVTEEVYPPSLAQEEARPQCSSNQHDLEIEISPSIDADEQDSEASDMQWEAGEYSASYFDDDVDDSIQTNNESDLEKGYSLEVDNCTSHDEHVFMSDCIVSSCFEEILADEVLQESFHRESVSSEAWLLDGHSELNGSYQDSESDESIQVSGYQNHDQFSPTSDAFEESKTTEEKDGHAKSDDCVETTISSCLVGEPMEEPREASEDTDGGGSEEDNKSPQIVIQLGDDNTECSVSIEDKASIDHQANESLQDDDGTALLGNQESDNSHDSTGDDWKEICKNKAGSHKTTEDNQSNVVARRNRFSDEVFDGSLLPMTQDSESDQHCLVQRLFTVDAGDGPEKEQDDASKSLCGIQVFDLMHGSSEADRDMTSEGYHESQPGAIVKDNNSIRTFADEDHPAETQDSSDKQSRGNNVIENQNRSEENREEAKNFIASNFMDSEYQTHPEISRISFAEDQGVHEMGKEHETTQDAEERCVTMKDSSSTGTKTELFQAGSNSNQELPMTITNPRGIVRCKRPIEEKEEPREFNPREPNYLPVEPDPEAERVDLRHQMMDERKNAEEWMLDYALRQTVSKLGPARKRKVALLVEAFESVTPIPKYETRRRHSSAAFAHARPIQACS